MTFTDLICLTLNRAGKGRIGFLGRREDLKRKTVAG